MGRLDVARSERYATARQFLGASSERPWVSRPVRPHGARLQLAALGFRKSLHPARWVVTGRYWDFRLGAFQSPQPANVWVLIEAWAFLADLNLAKGNFNSSDHPRTLTEGNHGDQCRPICNATHARMGC